MAYSNISILKKSTNSVTAQELYHAIVGRALEPDLLAPSYRSKDRMYTNFKYQHKKFKQCCKPLNFLKLKFYL